MNSAATRGIKKAKREQRQITEKYRKTQKIIRAWQRWYNKWHARGERYNQRYDKTGKEKYARMARKAEGWLGRSEEEIRLYSEQLPDLEERYNRLEKYIENVSRKYREAAEELEEAAKDYPE